MKRVVKISVVFVLMVLVHGCASIVSKSSWPVTINTNPSGAKIEIIDKKGKVVYSGISPVYTNLNSTADYFEKQSYRVKISLAGYSERIIPIECKVNGWYFGNIFLGGFSLVGFLIIDPITGAMFKLDRDFVSETLEKDPVASTESLKVVALQDIPQDWKEHLVAVE